MSCTWQSSSEPSPRAEIQSTELPMSPFSNLICGHPSAEGTHSPSTLLLTHIFGELKPVAECTQSNHLPRSSPNGKWPSCRTDLASERWPGLYRLRPHMWTLWSPHQAEITDDGVSGALVNPLWFISCTAVDPPPQLSTPLHILLQVSCWCPKIMKNITQYS